MENEFKTVTNAKGLEIPKYPKDFKKLVEKDRQLAEYLCMNYENLESEDLGAFLETVEQGLSWILDLIDSKELYKEYILSGKPDFTFPNWLTPRMIEEIAKGHPEKYLIRIPLAYLNHTVGKNYKYLDKNLKPIMARFKEG